MELQFQKWNFYLGNFLLFVIFLNINDFWVIAVKQDTFFQFNLLITFAVFIVQ